ncbi:TPA: 50S ribosomal protein L13, partial [Candidatus Poribacteria bacterium]|nr:50S ribosomal protein L13 [Candidatus Poribacteria bacterium]
LASQIAKILRGKHVPTSTPHADMGFGVIVVNAEKIRVTGKKLDEKMYYRHSGYIGGLKVRSLRQMLERNPERVIAHAVWGMLPKNRLGRKLFRRLKVYAGPDHPHKAQKPEPLEMEF